MAEEHNIPKTYDPASVEKKWYQFWEKNKYFHAERNGISSGKRINISTRNRTRTENRLPLSFRLPILQDSCTWGMPWTTRCRIS